MRQTLAGKDGSTAAYRVLMEQLHSSNEELEVRKEEVLILRSQLVSQKEAVQHKVYTHTHTHTHPTVRRSQVVSDGLARSPNSNLEQQLAPKNHFS